VLQVYDEAGLDPNPGLTLTQPPVSAGVWRVPVQTLGLNPRDWVHLSVGVDGNRPDQLQLLVDGVPRGQASYRTRLTSSLDQFQPNGNVFQTQPLQDTRRFVQLRVEDASTFPQQGVVRIGDELFEYTSRTQTTLQVGYQDSIGGRMARVDHSSEFVQPVPTQSLAANRGLANQILQTGNNGQVPALQQGASVELYGYSLPVYPLPGIPLRQGEYTLREGIGAFCVARVCNGPADSQPIYTAPNQSGFQYGFGISNDQPQAFDLVLADPVPDANTQPAQITTANELVVSAFPATGGFVLLCQRGFFNGGGMELVSYASRQGNRLQGVQRGAQSTLGLDFSQFNPGNGQLGNFVTDWETFGPNGEDLDDFDSNYVYAVPVSLPLVNPPPISTHTEWLQLRVPGAQNDALTEWVRYDQVVGNDVVRIDAGAFALCRLGLVADDITGFVQPPPGQQQPQFTQASAVENVQRVQPPSDGTVRIGAIDQVETQFLAAYGARIALGFRGDPFTRTTSHAFAQNAQVLPVHRFEFHWLESGVRAARAGRLDRVALVAGLRRANGGNLPAVEWHTVNWVAREYNWQEGLVTFSPSAGQGVYRGEFPFQLVAFQTPVTGTFLGGTQVPSNRAPFDDVRLLDRMVKFPSGELPAEEASEVTFGSAPVGASPVARGVLDEAAVGARTAIPRLLTTFIPANGGNNFSVRVDAMQTPSGVLIDSARPRQLRIVGPGTYPQNGGMLRIGQELIAYRAFDPGSGQFQIAQDGRGLLGTVPSSHAVGEEVYFVDQIPTAILVNGVVPEDHEFGVQALDALPRQGGTLLLGRTELVHYTWTAGNQLLGMPRHPDPERDDPTLGDRPTGGLFRGRYGTIPTSAAANAPLIWMPFRYWDRYVEGSSDPECSFVQVTFNRGAVEWTGFGFDEQNDDELLDLRAAIRFDEVGDWRDVTGLDVLRFVDGRTETDTLHDFERLAGRAEVRFGVEYRAGAFNPGTFQAHAWKRSPELRGMVLRYEGQTRILEEVVTSR
jgi:hypothetical protein